MPGKTPVGRHTGMVAGGKEVGQDVACRGSQLTCPLPIWPPPLSNRWGTLAVCETLSQLQDSRVWDEVPFGEFGIQMSVLSPTHDCISLSCRTESPFYVLMFVNQPILFSSNYNNVSNSFWKANKYLCSFKGVLYLADNCTLKGTTTW